MLTPDPRARCGALEKVSTEVDADLVVLERRIAAGDALPLAATVEQAIDLIRRLVITYIAAGGKKPVPDASADILDVFKVLVQGEPSWAAIRDNCRELVYYRNCINMERQDALPAAPGKMAVRTARHVYLYISGRAASAKSIWNSDLLPQRSQGTRRSGFRVVWILNFSVDSVPTWLK